MLIQICNKCGSESENLSTVSIQEGNTTSHLNVCQRCYTMLMNEKFQQESKLLNG